MAVENLPIFVKTYDFTLKKYQPPNFLVSSLPKEIELLMASALDPDPKTRIADAMELFESLKAMKTS